MLNGDGLVNVVFAKWQSYQSILHASAMRPAGLVMSQKNKRLPVCIQSWGGEQPGFVRPATTMTMF
ncbi:MAG: hypothetical protein A2Z01_00825 [Betaproteobacteria bacterium RBG_16_58_11]|nr:MAG: hypothetical protein A2Z01_00825 [Betaproteobacteria bacterium RBG_16_58_11]OFZ99542.1 MAG: hypothetical protein A2Z44_05390 [Betaproteobacteria bacterium RBG_19FT_COMBO_58_11]